MTEAANSGSCVKVMWLEGLFRYGAFLTFCVQTQCGHKLTLHTHRFENALLFPLSASPLVAAATSSFTKTRNRC